MTHPRGLYVLSVTEGQERYGFYAMLSLLLLYCMEALHLSEAQSLDLVGTYVGLVYLSTLPGGFIADKIGYLLSAFIGGSLMIAGHIEMAMGGIKSLYIALGLLIVGNGLFKPSLPALVRNLYVPGDKRLDSAFGIYYFAVNVGAGLAAFLVAVLRAKFGWHIAFGSAAVALTIGLVQLYFQRHHIKEKKIIPVVEKLETKNNWQKVTAILLLSSVAMFFWMAFNQNASTMTLWVRDCVDRKGIPPETFQASNSIGVLLFTTPILWLSSYFQLKTSTKIILGMLFTALSYFVLTLVSKGMHVNMAWPIVSYLIITIGELLVSPMGLSMVNKLAPYKYVGLCMGTWYLFIAAGGKLAGKLGLLWSRTTHPQFFTILVLTSLLAAFLMYCGRNKLEKSISLSIKE